MARYIYRGYCFSDGDLSSGYNASSEIASEWGEGKYKYANIKFSSSTSGYYGYSDIISIDGIFQYQVDPSWVGVDENVNNNLIPYENGPKYLPSFSLRSGSNGYYVVYAADNSEIQVEIEKGYEFFGWRYNGPDSSGYLICSELNDTQYPAILKPDYNFRNDFEVIDAKKGIYKVKDSYYGESGTSSDYSYKVYLYVIVPIVKYIERKLIFDTTGGDEVESIDCKGEEPITLPLPVREGYSFGGWYSNENLNAEYKVGDSGDSYFPPADNYVLYAKWNPLPITVSLDANGGVVAPEIFVVYIGDRYGNNLVAPVRDKYKFDGWYTEKEGGEKITAATIVDTPGDRTLYAHWVGVKIKIVKKSKKTQSEIQNIGKLQLYSYTTLETYQEKDGVIEVELPSGECQVTCSMALTGADFYWKPVGIETTPGVYEVAFSFSLEAGVEKEFEYYLAEKSFYSLFIDCKTEEGNVEITSPETADSEDGKYVEGRDIVVKVTAKPGYEFVGATLLDVVTNKALATYDRTETFTVDDIYCDCKLVFYFERKKYQIKVKVDDFSKEAISNLEVLDAKGFEVSDIYYNDEVQLKAYVGGGFIFDGWYKNAEKVSDNDTYVLKVTESVDLIAKAAVNVRLNILYNDNRENADNKLVENCKLIIDENEREVPYSFNVILGKSFSYKLVEGLWGGEGESWHFSSWKCNEEIVDYPVQGEITPYEQMELVATVDSIIPHHIITVEFYNDDGETDVKIPVLSEDWVRSIPEGEVSLTNENLLMSFRGSISVNLKFIEEIIVDEQQLSFSYATFGNKYIDIPEGVFVLNDDVTIKVRYGTTGTRSTIVDYASHNDRSMGIISIAGNTSQQYPTPIKVTTLKYEEIELAAEPMNGYMFVGWFVNENGSGAPMYSDSHLKLVVKTNRTLYARFAKNTNAIYEWEGDEGNKVMEWRSKTYVSSKPFNPSACRIDTTGYSIKSFSVEMFSSPDAKPTRIATLNNVSAQESRRLPVLRPERFLQVSVKNDSEVDGMFISTSVRGLSV